MVNEQDKLAQLEASIGYRFDDRNLLVEALTHRSYLNETSDAIRDNERLEFLGDAVLDYIVADMLFRRFAMHPEGTLSQLRSALVKEDSLARLGAQVELSAYLRMGRGEYVTGGHTRPSTLCRAFEALMGAIHMDGGLEAARRFAVPLLQALLDYILEHNLHRDARSILQERSQMLVHFTPVYRLIEETGPEHGRHYRVEVMIGKHPFGQGLGSNKRIAAQEAAKAALERIDTEGWSPLEIQDVSLLDED